VSSVLVFVHGLWMTGREAFWLRRRLAHELAAENRVFSYPSVSAGMADNAAALGRLIGSCSADRLHLVGHSLGGLVILKLFQEALFANGRPPAPGRIVLLGSPLCGSRAAQALARLPFGRRDLGVIAGEVSVGLGRLLVSLPAPNDGVVTVGETRLAGATEHRVLKVSHSGMLFSGAVVRQTAAFLRAGRFAP
jgi:pimeloyl-ACP methyl ester carboxylesterase